MDFNYVRTGEKLGKVIPKTRGMCILEFQHRILDIAELDETPTENKINFVKIVKSNLIEFIQTRLIEIKSYTELQVLKTEIKSLFTRGSLLLDKIYKDEGLTIDFSSRDDRPWEPLHEKIQISHWSYINTGESDNVIMNEMEDLLQLRTADDQYFVLCNFGTDTESLQKYFNAYEEARHIQDALEVPTNMLLLDKYPQQEMSFKVKEVCNFTESIECLPIGRHILYRTPYFSYVNTTVRFIAAMCENEEVDTVFITLYRTAKDSLIVKSLIHAAHSGKNVYAYVELTASGDEEHNLKVAKELIAHGVHVKVGYLGYKVHAKMCIAANKKFGLMAHVGTGNYNEDTAKIYTDYNMITTDQCLCQQLMDIMFRIFQDSIITQFEHIPAYQLVHCAPISLRDAFMKYIYHVKRMASYEPFSNEDNSILIKCNHLFDKTIIQKLYDAADSGVRVKIICRTCCGIIPRKNLEVRSKVGEYLEHDRFYIFGKDFYFISSADLMTRNLSKRVELLIPILGDVQRMDLETTFFKIWNSANIHQLNEFGEWELINKRLV